MKMSHFLNFLSFFFCSMSNRSSQYLYDNKPGKIEDFTPGDTTDNGRRVVRTFELNLKINVTNSNTLRKPLKLCPDMAIFDLIVYTIYNIFFYFLFLIFYI